jgi:GDP-L-fucose synthase
MLERFSKIWVAGHNGLVGSALVRALETAKGNAEILTAAKSELDLRDQGAVRKWSLDNKPDLIFLAAAKVGGIGANASRPAEFLYDNLAIQTNVIDAAYRAGTGKLVFLGSSCIYPKQAAQPILPEYLLTGPLEPTNEAYAIAKIAGIKMCQAYRAQYGCDFISVMPCNLYGPGDRWDDPEGAHVIPALIRRFHEAKINNADEVVIWGSGKPLREFLYVDDLAAAILLCADSYEGDIPVNIGSGAEISIADLAQTIADVVGFEGQVVFDGSKPDGTPRKVLDSSQIRAMGWGPKVSLQGGLIRAYEDFLKTASL